MWGNLSRQNKYVDASLAGQVSDQRILSQTRKSFRDAQPHP